MAMKAGEIVEQGGKNYLVVGKTFGTKTKLSPGDRFVLEGETLNLERDESGKVVKAGIWVPEVIEPTDKAADSLEAIVKRAKEHGVLQEKVRHENGKVEYLPTDAGKPGTASKEFEGAAVMLFLPTEQAKKLAALVDVDGAKLTKPKDMHLTLAFLGKAKDLEEKRPLIEAVLDRFAEQSKPILGKVGGAGRFLKVEEDGTNAVYASFDSSGLSALREKLVSSLESIGVDLGSDHDFTPHITLAYAQTDTWELPKVEPVEVEFDKITLGWGDERKAFKLKGKEGKKAEAEAYPDESKKLRFVAQNHYRGKSCHLDLRFEFKRANSDYLRGWTVAHQVAGAIKEPVTTMAQAEKADANLGNWKMDLKTGLIKPRKIRGGTVRRGDLRAFQKAAEIPKDWLNTEGVTEKQDPGERPPAGATQQFPGVFTILDKGEVEWGAQKPWFTEFFLEGNKWKGRWCFRLVKREGEKWYAPETVEEYEAVKAEILPPGKEEEEARTGSYWVLMQPESKPYVLSREATSENWLPPKGISCLPAKMRKSVPKELQFWTMDRKEALEARDKLAEFEELGGTELKLLVLRELIDE